MPLPETLVLNQTQYSQGHYLLYKLATGEHTVGKVESQEEQNFSPKVYVSDPKVKELIRS